MKKAIGLLALLMLAGCTDTQFRKITSLGKSGTIECWSGGKLIFRGESTGKISSEQNSDGYYFKDKSDNRLKEVSGNCVIDYGSKG